jgi:hypothetical protein
MKISLIILLIVFSLNVFSQITFQQVYHKDSLMLNVNHVEMTYDYGYIIVGSVSNYQLFGSGPRDIFMIRTDSTGNILWSRRWDLGNDESVFASLSTPDLAVMVSS